MDGAIHIGSGCSGMFLRKSPCPKISFSTGDQRPEFPTSQLLFQLKYSLRVLFNGRSKE